VLIFRNYFSGEIDYLLNVDNVDKRISASSPLIE